MGLGGNPVGEKPSIICSSAQQPQMANGGSSGASRRESMDRGSSTFSPSLSEQYKNKAAAVNAAAGAGWPTSYGALGAASGLGLGLTGSGSLTPPPPNAAGLTAAQAAASFSTAT